MPGATITVPSTVQAAPAPTTNVLPVPVKLSIRGSRAVCESSPDGEGAAKSVDGDPSTKFVCDKSKEGLGGIEAYFYLPAVLTGLSFMTGNDCPRRDPVRVRVSGRVGSFAVWRDLGTVTLSLPDKRSTSTGPFPVSNSASFSSYRVVVETKKTDAPCEYSDDVMQFAEIKFFGKK